MSKAAVLAAILMLAACATEPPVVLDRQSPATFPEEPGGYEGADVVRVVDGDTIRVVIRSVAPGPGAGLAEVGREYPVRLIGIDTPESVREDFPVECFGREASAALGALLENQTVRLVKDVEETDRFDRLLRYVYFGEEMANARLVANGYAHAFTYPPNIRHSKLFVQLERDARDNDRGLWAPESCDGRP